MKKPKICCVTKDNNTYLCSPEGEIICWATTKFLKKYFNLPLTKTDEKVITFKQQTTKD